MKSQENTGLEKHDQQFRSEAGYQKNIAAGAGKDRLGEVVQLSDVISQFNETKATFDRVWKVLEERVTERAEQLSQQNLQLQQEIVERKHVQQALLESEKRFRELAETIQDVFWVGTPDWREVFYVSPAYEKIWGQSCDSLYEQPLSWLDPLPKEDRERVLT